MPEPVQKDKEKSKGMLAARHSLPGRCSASNKEKKSTLGQCCNATEKKTSGDLAAPCSRLRP